MVDIQLLNDALLTVAFTVGVAIVVAISIVASAALWRRHEHSAGVREIEQHLGRGGHRAQPSSGELTPQHRPAAPGRPRRPAVTGPLRHQQG
jgi:hypothetical protein